MAANPNEMLSLAFSFSLSVYFILSLSLSLTPSSSIARHSSPPSPSPTHRHARNTSNRSHSPLTPPLPRPPLPRSHAVPVGHTLQQRRGCVRRHAARRNAKCAHTTFATTAVANCARPPATPARHCGIRGRLHVATFCNTVTLQHAATRCNTLQHVATRCNTCCCLCAATRNTCNTL